MGSLHQVLHILQARFVSYVETLAIQPSHETFENALPLGDQALCIRRHVFGVFQQKQLLKAATSSNVSALRASFLVADSISKAKKPFPVGEELILPAA